MGCWCFLGGLNRDGVHQSGIVKQAFKWLLSVAISSVGVHREDDRAGKTLDILRKVAECLCSRF